MGETKKHKRQHMQNAGALTASDQEEKELYGICGGVTQEI